MRTNVLSSCVIIAFSVFVSAFVIFFPAVSVSAQPAKGTALILEIQGVIGPAVAEYIQKGLAAAEERNATVVILEMDTPGGLDKAMRTIIKDILASSVPVATYVAPEGSRAASAGTYILYGSHIAAMAPATNLGAATPIRLGGWTGKEKSSDQSEAEKEQDQKSPGPLSTIERKMLNDAEAYIKALAAKHGRNGEWAAQAVREAVSLSAEEALAIEVIDIIATDVDDLLLQMDQRNVTTAAGDIILHTADCTLIRFSPDWRTRLLIILTDPNIAYILMLLGIYGLFFELANPGAIFPGVIGAIALVMAMYTFQILPVNYAGLALLVLGLCFMVAEAFVPSFGALGFGGIAAFVTGSVILMDEPFLRISLPLVITTALTSAVFLTVLLSRLFVIRRRKVRTGTEQMIGSLGEALEDFTETGRIWVHGESWLAHCSHPVKKGQRVRVIGKEGLTLKLETIDEERDHV